MLSCFVTSCSTDQFHVPGMAKTEWDSLGDHLPASAPVAHPWSYVDRLVLQKGTQFVGQLARAGVTTAGTAGVATAAVAQH